MPDIAAYFKLAWELLLTPNGVLTVLAAAGAFWLYRLHARKNRIPGLEIELIREDTWFVNRDTDHRLIIVISAQLTNKSGQEVRLTNVTFSGWSPTQETQPILLEGRQVSVPLPFPAHDQYWRGLDFRVPPFTTRKLWLHYESGNVDLRNRLSAPLAFRSDGGKRTSVPVEMIRHPYQMQLYQAGWA